MYVDQANRMRRWLLLGALLLVLLLILCTCNESGRIQADLIQRGELALREGGYDPALLSVNGRDLTLSGVSLSPEAKVEMLELVRSVRGVRVVNDELSVEAAVPAPPELIFSTFDDSVTLSGAVPEAARDELVAAAEALYPDSVTDDLEVVPELGTPPWLNGLVASLPNVKEATTDVQLSVQDNALTLEGEAVNDEARAELETTLNEATNVAVDNRLGVAGEPLTEAATFEDLEDAAPGTAAFSLDLAADGTTLTGVVDPATQAALTSAARGLTGGEVITDGLSIEEAVAAPPWLPGLVEVLPQIGNEVNGAGLDLEGDQLTLRGSVPSEAGRGALEETLRSAVGPGVDVVNELTVVEASTGAELSSESQNAASSQQTMQAEAAAASAEAGHETLSETVAPEPQPTPEQTDDIEAVVAETKSDAELEAAPDTQETEASAEVATEAASETTDTASAADETGASGEGEDSTISTSSPEVGEAEAAAPSESIDPETEEAVTSVSEAQTPEAVGDSVAPVTAEAAALQAPSVRVAILGDTVELRGTVATQEDFRLAETAFATKTVQNNLRVDAGVASPEWLGDLYEVSLRVDGNANRPILEVEDGTLSLLGTVASEAMRGAVGDYVEGALTPPLTLDNRLDVQPLIPFSEDGK